MRDVLGIFVISRALVLFIGYLSNLVIIKGEYFNRPFTPRSLLDLFFRWDSGWYLNIAKSGYSYIQGQQSSVNFFPLYPTLINFFSFSFFDSKLIGFILSNLFLLLAGIYLYKLVKLEFKNPDLAYKAVFYLMIFPTSFFFSTPYTESLFLFLSIAAFYYAIKREWLLASTLGFFLALTRCVGVLILAPFAIEYFGISLRPLKPSSLKLKRDALYLLLVPFGLLTYMAYTYFRFGDAFAFYHTASAWNRRFVSIFATLSNVSDYSIFYKGIFMGSVIFACFLILYFFLHNMRLSYAIYSLVYMAGYLSSNVLEGMPRYISALFPLYIALSLICAKNKFLDILFTLFFVGLLSLFTILFVNGYKFT